MRRLSIAVLGVIGVAILIAGLSGIAGGPSTALGGAAGNTTTPYTLSKYADAPQVPAGQPIGFTIELINSGQANVMYIDDPLPGGPGIAWVVSPNNQTCQIGGNPPSQSLACTAQNANDITVHVMSQTTTQSCGTYDNTALGAVDGGADISDHASTTVACGTATATATATPAPTPATPRPPDVTGTVEDGRISITYNPGDEASICDKIVFVQIIKNTVEKKGDATKNKTGVKPTDMNVEGGATKDTWQTPGGSYVDAKTVENDPYYNGWDSPDDGVDGDGNQADSNHQGKKTAAGSTKSTMNDKPSGYDADAFKALSQQVFGDDTSADKITKEFTDIIFCAAGDDAGECFGYYTWTLTQEKGSDPVVTGGASHSGNPPADAVAALNKWKDKHPGNDVPKVACP